MGEPVTIKVGDGRAGGVGAARAPQGRLAVSRRAFA
jgi:hypothetical protein